jgi:hypothetical protein
MRKTIYRSCGVLSILVGLCAVAFLSTSRTLLCSRVKLSNKFCTYGFFPTLHKSQCVAVQDNDIICEIIGDYIHPNFHSSVVAKNPNGSSVIFARGAGDGRKDSRPKFSVVNYHTKDRLVLANFSNEGLEAIKTKQKSFNQFLLDKNQKTFQAKESNPYTYIYIIPVIGTSMIACIACFQKAVFQSKE